jgi:hypothetical protein
MFYGSIVTFSLVSGGIVSIQDHLLPFHQGIRETHHGYAGLEVLNNHSSWPLSYFNAGERAHFMVKCDKRQSDDEETTTTNNNNNSDDGENNNSSPPPRYVLLHDDGRGHFQ